MPSANSATSGECRSGVHRSSRHWPCCASLPTKSEASCLCGPLRIDLVSPPLERRGKAAESDIEHGSHEETERAAAKFISNEEFHDAGLGAGRMKDPSILEPAEGSIEVFNKDVQAGPIERYAAGERLMHEFVGNRHVGNKDFNAFRPGDSFSYLERLAKRHELRIALDICNEVEHFGSRMTHPALGRELRHQDPSTRIDSFIRSARATRLVRAVSERIWLHAQPLNGRRRRPHGAKSA